MPNISIIGLLVSIPGAVMAITIHEYIKAVCSARQGDPLPKSRGRLTLNPLKHLEPIGFICTLVYGFGWGRPVETSATYYKDRKKNTLITYIMPSVANLLIGCLVAALLYIAMNTVFPQVVVNIVNRSYGYVASRMSATETAFFYGYYIIYYMARCNIAIAIFNVIPIYPMDGSKVLSVFLSPNNALKMTANEKIFQLILFMLLFLNVISTVINPICNAILGFM